MPVAEAATAATVAQRLQAATRSAFAGATACMQANGNGARLRELSHLSGTGALWLGIKLIGKLEVPHKRARSRCRCAVQPAAHLHTCSWSTTSPLQATCLPATPCPHSHAHHQPAPMTSLPRLTVPATSGTCSRLDSSSRSSTVVCSRRWRAGRSHSECWWCRRGAGEEQRWGNEGGGPASWTARPSPAKVDGGNSLRAGRVEARRGGPLAEDLMPGVGVRELEQHQWRASHPC